MEIGVDGLIDVAGRVKSPPPPVVVIVPCLRRKVVTPAPVSLALYTSRNHEAIPEATGVVQDQVCEDVRIDPVTGLLVVVPWLGRWS